FGNKLKRGAEALVDAAVDLIKAQGATAGAVIDLRLTGMLNLDRIALDQTVACAEIQKASGVYAVTMDTTSLNLAASAAEGDASVDTQAVSREELEKTAIRKIVEAENLWGLDGRQDDFAALFYQLKEHVRVGKTGEELAEVISQSPLTGSIQGAMA